MDQHRHNVFWRTRPLTGDEQELFDEVLRAHSNSVFRENISSVTITNAAVGSGDYFKAVGAALLTLGGKHAPIEATYDLLSDPLPSDRATFILDAGEKVPGWGNSFYRGIPDAVWQRVDSLLFNKFPAMHETLESVTSTLHQRGKNLRPNPSAYTAAAAILLGIPKRVGAYLLIAGRLANWSDLFLKGVSHES